MIIFSEIASNSVIKLVVLMLVLDTIFGVLRAVKQKTFNSSFGIDGALRKIGMVIGVLALFLIDCIVNINLTPFLSADILQYIGLESIGMTEFFGLLFIVYEIISCLKNCVVLGIPIPKKLAAKIEEWLNEYTNELSDIKTK